MYKEYLAAYKQLNSAQKLAVDTIEGPVLVVAGPGTGKTQLLSLRVANILIKTDTDPGNILCLTFTNKAAVNMRERLYELIGATARNVVVRTFHSFAADIMNQYPDYFWNGARLSVAPDAIQMEIVQEILASLPSNNPLATTFAGAYTALGDVKQALKLAKEAGLTPEELSNIINKNQEYIDDIEPTMVDIFSSSLSYKKLTDLQAKIDKLPRQKTDTTLVLPLDQLLSESLAQAIVQDMHTNKTKNTGKWKSAWLQTVDGKKGLFKERRRNEWWSAVAKAYEIYRQKLHQRGYYDYSDMMIEVLEQMQSESDMRADIQERFPYVLIDEFQDTNAAQLRLAHLVADHFSANNRPNLMAVGDDDQSIFAFNGAELNNMLGFRRSYPDTKLIILKENYRSTQPILDTSKAIIEQAEDRLVSRESDISKELVAKSVPKSGKIEHHSYPTRQHQQNALAEQIQNLWDSEETDIAVLARKHQSLEQLASILQTKGVPIKYERRNNVLEHEAVIQACLVAEIATAIASGSRDEVNAKLAQLIRHPMWQIDAKTLWKLAGENYSQPDWLGSLLRHDDAKLNNIGSWLVWLSRSGQQQPLRRSMDYILGLEQGEYLTSPLRDYYLANRPVSDEYLQTLSAIRLLHGLADEFADGKANLTDFVRFVELNRSTGSVIADESWFVSGKKAVQLLTVHKAKGLEFDHVFVVDAVENMWRPRVGSRGSPANLQLKSYGEKYDDYVRLLYVAITRARQSFVATSYFSDDNGDEILPTPLISALPLSREVSPAEDSIEILESALRWPRLNTQDEHALLSERLENFSLSQTALINFLNIVEAGPESFMERHLLHIPKPRSPEGSYGTAIHAALETAQRLVNTSKLNQNTVLDRFESTLIDEHMAPLDYKRFKLRGEELIKKLFAEGGLRLNKGALSEQYVRDIRVGQARINGKIDSIDATADQTIISDYKTGKALTSFDTKDKNKQVKAWRHRKQLLFYTLLVQNTPRLSAKKPILAQMIYLEADRANQRVLQLTPAVDELQRLQGLIKAVYNHIMKLDFPDTTKYSSNFTGIVKFEDDLLGGKI